MPVGGLVVLICVIKDGNEWHRRRWRVGWLGGAHAKIRDGSIS